MFMLNIIYYKMKIAGRSAEGLFRQVLLKPLGIVNPSGSKVALPKIQPQRKLIFMGVSLLPQSWQP